MNHPPKPFYATEREPFIRRVFSMHPLAILVGCCAILITLPLSAYLWLRVIHEGQFERLVTKTVAEVVNQRSDALQTFVGDWLKSNLVPPVNRIADSAAAMPDTAKNLVDAHATRIENKLDAHLTRIEDETVGERGIARQALDIIDRRTGEVVHTADALRQDVNAEMASLNSTVSATAAPVQELVTDAKDSWDDLYDDVRGTVASGTVLATSTAQAMEAIRDAAPRVTAAAAGIAEDGHEMTSIARRWAAKNVDPHPMTRKEKAAAVAKVAVALTVAALRGGLL